MITHLYSANITGSTNYEHINLTQFAWDTKPDIGLVLGEIWKLLHLELEKFIQIIEMQRR